MSSPGTGSRKTEAARERVVLSPQKALELGWSIIPTGRDKRPIITSWKPFQTRPPTQAEVTAWDARQPATWAIVTGSVSGMIILDFDGEPGRKTLDTLRLKPHVKTPSGGFHVYFRAPGWKVPTLNGKTKRELGDRWPGLDIRADGGYAVFLGRTGRGEYVWLREPDPHELDILPSDLRLFLGLLKAPEPDLTSGKGKFHTNGRVEAERLIHMALDRVATEGRNNTGHWLACQLRDNGYSMPESEGVMRTYRSRAPDVNSKGDREAYTEAELLATLREAYSRPAREPWSSGRADEPKSSGLKASTSQIAAPDWKTKLILNENGTPKAVLANAITALRSASEFDGVLGFNEFTSNVVALKPLPWRDLVVCNEWTDHEDRLTADWLQHRGIYVRVDIAAQAVLVVARDRPFHPVREYLDALEWDGTRRIDAWLTTYLGVDSSESSELEEAEETKKRADYVAAVGARWLISAVVRIYNPGAKVDYCLILEGPQGIGKSRSLRILGGPWFTDEISDLGSKDAAMQTRGIWIIEIAELESMTRPEVGRIKDFMSRSVDRFRPPYGRHLILSPRQCVFAGSVNHSTYLKDETGGRRFWPVTCKQIRLAELERDRDQLWAEAVVCYRNGAVWWPDSAELNLAAEQEQNDRYVEDAWDSRIAEFVSKLDDVSVPEVLEQCIRKPVDQWNQVDQNRVVKCLAKLGWKQRRRGPRGGIRKRRYYSPQLTLGI